jgi:A/G-specific adenine glycosylase
MMELGATVCRARRPECEACPISRWCASAGRPLGAQPARRRPPRARQAPLEADPGRPAAGTRLDVPFERTSRWLRGRIVATLRDLEGDAWGQVPDVLGSHGPDGIALAVAALRRDGLVEQRADGALRLPSRLP